MLKPSRDKTYPTIGNLGSMGFDIENENGEVGYIDVESSEFTKEGDMMLYRMVADEINPDLEMAIDIPTALLGSRAIKTLEDTATPDKRETAINKVIETADLLTEQRFSKAATNLDWSRNTVLAPQPILVPMGYWIDPNGNRRDLREINYLDVRQYTGEHDMDDIVFRWDASIAMSNQTIGAAERIDIIKTMVGADAVHVKGYAWRYMIDPVFLVSLSQATIVMGIAPSFNNFGTARPDPHAWYVPEQQPVHGTSPKCDGLLKLNALRWAWWQWSAGQIQPSYTLAVSIYKQYGGRGHVSSTPFYLKFF